MTIRGEPAFGRAYKSRHNLVFGGSKDPNHDAVMRIGSEAPKRRTHSLLRRDKPWSPPGHRHLEPSLATRHEWTGWAKTVGCLLRPPVIVTIRRLAMPKLVCAASPGTPQLSDFYPHAAKNQPDNILGHKSELLGILNLLNCCTLPWPRPRRSGAQSITRALARYPGWCGQA